jgi:hypothetical protein
MRTNQEIRTTRKHRHYLQESEIIGRWSFTEDDLTE